MLHKIVHLMSAFAHVSLYLLLISLACFSLFCIHSLRPALVNMVVFRLSSSLASVTCVRAAHCFFVLRNLCG